MSELLPPEPTERPRKPANGWLILAVLIAPGLLSIPAAFSTRNNYMIGGAYVLLVAAPIAGIVATVLCRFEQGHLSKTLHVLRWIACAIGSTAAAIAIAFGCCMAVGIG